MELPCDGRDGFIRDSILASGWFPDTINLTGVAVFPPWLPRPQKFSTAEPVTPGPARNP